MGQKVNPLSFRSNEILTIPINNWFLNINHFNYNIILHQDLEIQKIFTDFFKIKKILLHNIKIFRSYDFLNIKLFIYLNTKKLLKKNNVKKIKKKKKNKLKKKFLIKKKIYVLNIYTKYLIYLIKKNLKLNKFFNVKINLIILNKKFIKKKNDKNK